jgi:hypothetical protein
MSIGRVPETTSLSPSPNSESNHNSDREGSEDEENKGSDVDSGCEKEDSEEEEEALKDKGDVDDSGPDYTHAQNTCSLPWQPWQDHLLITQVNADQPFQQPQQSCRAAWGATADSMALVSAQQGPNLYFTRSREACKAQFKLLAKKYKVRHMGNKIYQTFNL